MRDARLAADAKADENDLNSRLNQERPSVVIFSRAFRAFRGSKILPDAVRNFLDDRFAEAVLQTIQNLLPAIAHDFREPGAAVHVHEQSPLVQIGWLRMGGDRGGK